MRNSFIKDGKLLEIFFRLSAESVKYKLTACNYPLVKVRKATFCEAKRVESILFYSEFLISTTSLLRVPRESASCRPSGEKAKLKMRLESKLVI